MEVNSGRFDGRANLKPWKPGQSGNSAGKLIGTRQAFSQGFIKDFSTVWQEEGLEAIRKVARKSPESFVAIAAKACPADVRISIEQSTGGLSPQDWMLVQEVVSAVKAALPDAGRRLLRLSTGHTQTEGNHQTKDHRIKTPPAPAGNRSLNLQTR